MKRATRPFLILLTVVALCLYGLVVSAGRLSAGTAFEMVICAEDGPETIWLDAGGTPVEAPAKTPAKCCDCQDCLSFAPAAVLTRVFAAPMRLPVPSRAATSLRTMPIAHPALTLPLSRGPPTHPADVATLSPARAGHGFGASVSPAPVSVEDNGHGAAQACRANHEVAR